MRPVLLGLFAAAILLPTVNARAADRAVTEQERPKLTEAVKAAGCTGGKLEFDDDKGAPHPNGKFEVDDATCDGKIYDLAFDPDFKLLKKKLD